MILKNKVIPNISKQKVAPFLYMVVTRSLYMQLLLYSYQTIMSKKKFYTKLKRPTTSADCASSLAQELCRFDVIEFKLARLRSKMIKYFLNLGLSNRQKGKKSLGKVLTWEKVWYLTPL